MTKHPRKPIAPPVYRPQSTPGVSQLKSKGESASKPAERKPVAPPVYRPQPLPGALQAKLSKVSTAIASRNTHSSAPIHPQRSLKVVHSKNGIQLKARPSRVIQRAELPPDEEKKFNPRNAVKLNVSLNGKELGAYVSKTSRFAAASEHDHAEDGIVHAIQDVLLALERSGGALTDKMSAVDVEIARALKFDTFNVLRIYNLTASPCTSSTTKKKTSNKGKGEGCAEQLIDLATTGLDLMIGDQILSAKFKISIEADHLYQPGADGAERALSKEASEDANKRMGIAGIKVKIG